MKYKPFYDGIFIENEKYRLGDYKVTYADGTNIVYVPKTEDVVNLIEFTY
jgi:hypothetical protein